MIVSPGVGIWAVLPRRIPENSPFFLPHLLDYTAGMLFQNYPLDHVGVATNDIDASVKEYERLLGLKVVHREIIATKEVELCFLALGNTRIELIAPCIPDGPVAKFLKSHGPGLHHLCYRVDNLVQELERLESLGVTLIDKKPRPGAHGAMIAFIHPGAFGGVLTELCEYPK